ncbi:nitrogenase molybdenum-iron protein beta chain [Paenibacillus forsythiae]|uniref:Nitrogenase molybdenum-iron protein beta chain n=1 Tax=Paenibacillus forsythiae TaxID=365616 RepID=A0ABU3H734_9BACL|nr:nitrogenase component 1 [Paenibacillus forsythiae]MDT3426629.1 nitrogenase molybdenum-iron protein beta chain [Paenibacillus forsythiae]
MAVTKNEHGQTNSINQVRYGCAVGALYSVVSIPGAVPIGHCGPGCMDKQYTSLAFYNGFQGSGYSGGSVSPSVNAGEKEVVFGGEKRLDELIKSTLKIIEGDLFVVLNGCIGELVGDDVGAVVSKYQKQGVPIVYAETGGFKGNNFVGHEIITTAIIDQYVDKFALNKDHREKGLINVWSELPYQNTFWRGDLSELKRILEGAGFRVNILFGGKSAGVEEWKTIPHAQFNLVVSPWLGLKTAKHLEQKYNQPYLHIPVLPIGAQQTAAFIRQVVEFAGIDPATSESFIEQEEQEYYYYLEHFNDFYSEYWWGLPATYAVVGDSTYNLALNKFLVNQLGLIPKKQIITDNAPEKYREAIAQEYQKLAHDVATTVDFVEDGYIVGKLLRETDFGHKPPIIFGTTWERDTAKALNGKIVEVGFPASYEVVLNKSYIGYRGALQLIEKIFTVAISASA